jgi:hypothetical protein
MVRILKQKIKQKQILFFCWKTFFNLFTMFLLISSKGFSYLDARGLVEGVATPKVRHAASSGRSVGVVGLALAVATRIIMKKLGNEKRCVFYKIFVSSSVFWHLFFDITWLSWSEKKLIGFLICFFFLKLFPFLKNDLWTYTIRARLGVATMRWRTEEGGRKPALDGVALTAAWGDWSGSDWSGGVMAGGLKKGMFFGLINVFVKNRDLKNL